jgi:spore germination protein KB
MLDARLKPFHAGAAILLVTIGTVFFPIAGVVVPLAGAAGWLAVLLAFAVALPWVFLAMWLVARAPVGDFGQAVQAWLGPWLGRLFLLYLGFIWAWLGGLLLAQSGMVTQTTALPNTPQAVLKVALLLLVVLTDLRGVEVFMRTLELLLLIGTPVVVVYLLIALSVVRVENLLPLFAEAPIRIAHAAVLALPWVMEGILFALFACVYVNSRQNLHRTAALAITLAGLLLSLTVVLTLGVLGRSVTESFVYPTVELTQVIHIGFFLQGLEGLLYPLWTIFSYIKVTAAFILVSESLRGIYIGFKQPYRALAVGALFLVISFLPGSFTELVASLGRVDNTFFMLMYVFLPLVCLFAYLRGRKEAKKPAPSRAVRRR